MSEHIHDELQQRAREQAVRYFDECAWPIFAEMAKVRALYGQPWIMISASGEVLDFGVKMPAEGQRLLDGYERLLSEIRALAEQSAKTVLPFPL